MSPTYLPVCLPACLPACPSSHLCAGGSVSGSRPAAASTEDPGPLAQAVQSTAVPHAQRDAATALSAAYAAGPDADYGCAGWHSVSAGAQGFAMLPKCSAAVQSGMCCRELCVLLPVVRGGRHSMPTDLGEGISFEREHTHMY